MAVKIRKSFADVDVEKKAYLIYSAYEEVPDNRSFSYGERKEILLRNEDGELEKIGYKLSGAVKLFPQGGYSWIFGQVESADYQGCLVFNYNENGGLEKITLSFCGDSPDAAEFEEKTKKVNFPAEATAIDFFSSNFHHR